MGNLVECMSIDCTTKYESNNNDLNFFDDENNGKSKKIINQIELYPEDEDNENNIYKKHYEENSIYYDKFPEK